MLMLVGTVFLDLSKAFDLIDNTILIYKLKLYRFSPLTLKLFKSYLERRTQMLQVGNINSETQPVSCGVPQVSIVGPLLFIRYINDMSFSKPSMNLDLYADDSTIFESAYTLAHIENKLQNDLNCRCKNK